MALVTSGSDLTVIVLGREEVAALAEVLYINRNFPAGISPALMNGLAELSDALDAVDWKD